MVQLESLSGSTAGAIWSARRFPFTVGRAPGNHLQLDAPGVWDQHLALQLHPQEGFVIEAHGDAMLAVNSSAVRRATLRNGDLINLGGASLRFWLAPAAQRSLKLREGLLWALFAGVLALQVALIYQFLD